MKSSPGEKPMASFGGGYYRRDYPDKFPVCGHDSGSDWGHHLEQYSGRHWCVLFSLKPVFFFNRVDGMAVLVATIVVWAHHHHPPPLLFAAGATTVSGALTAGTTLAVTGNTNLGGTLAVTGG